MWRRGLIAISVVTLVATACSDDGPALRPNPDLTPELVAPPVPEVFASGAGTTAEEVDYEWNVEEILGFSDALSFTASTDTGIRVRSASRQGMRDSLWLVATSLSSGGPSLIFGGVAAGIDTVMVTNDNGDSRLLELIAIPDRDWLLALDELPAEFAADEQTSVEVVALSDGDEIARESLSGLAG